MARITVEDCLERENNRFSLVLLAAKRAKQLLHGSRTVADEVKNKSVVTALREIAEGKVRFMTDEEEQQYRSRPPEPMPDRVISPPLPTLPLIDEIPAATEATPEENPISAPQDQNGDHGV